MKWEKRFNVKLLSCKGKNIREKRNIHERLRGKRAFIRE